MNSGKSALLATFAYLAITCQTASAVDQSASSQWTQIAPGVFQSVDAQGVVSRQAFGEEGARYDLVRLRDQLNATLAAGTSSDETLRAMREAIRVLEERTSGLAAGKQEASTQPAPQSTKPVGVLASSGLFGFSNTPTPVCGYVAHQFADFLGDASIAPGGGFGSATSSIAYFAGVIGITTPLTATFYVSATTSPGTTVSSSTTVTTGYALPTLIQRTSNSSSIAFSVAASTYSYMSISGCTGGFQSYTKSQTL